LLPRRISILELEFAQLGKLLFFEVALTFLFAVRREKYCYVGRNTVSNDSSGLGRGLCGKSIHSNKINIKEFCVAKVSSKVVSSGVDKLFSTADNSVLISMGSDQIVLLVDPTIDGSPDSDTITGTSDADTIFGYAGDDSLFGAAGDDLILGYSGNDTLNGGSGSDRLLSGADNDRIFGNNGNDTIYGGNGDDAINGGNDNDRVFGQEGNDKIGGDAGNDFLSGQNGNDTINGGAGNDNIYGGNDDDLLIGDAENDLLVGGRGVDRLVGGLGADSFGFTTWSDSGIGAGNRDVIGDFKVAQGDKIDLSFLKVGGSFVDFSDISFTTVGTNTTVTVFVDASHTFDIFLQGVNGPLSAADFIFSI
jgi:Ca2+-binding RTX toxin-like protein